MSAAGLRVGRREHGRSHIAHPAPSDCTLTIEREQSLQVLGVRRADAPVGHEHRRERVVGLLRPELAVGAAALAGGETVHQRWSLDARGTGSRIVQPEVELLQLALAHLEFVPERRRDVFLKALCDLVPHKLVDLALDLFLHCPDYQKKQT